MSMYGSIPYELIYTAVASSRGTMSRRMDELLFVITMDCGLIYK